MYIICGLISTRHHLGDACGDGARILNVLFAEATLPIDGEDESSRRLPYERQHKHALGILGEVAKLDAAWQLRAQEVANDV